MVNPVEERPLQIPATPANEAARLRALVDLAILDTDPEPGFDGLTELAAHIAGTPIALVSLVDADRQWFKSRFGLDAPQTPRDVSFCGHVVAAEEVLVVPDAHLDDRFADNPLVVGEPRVRFYAGFPLRTAAGYVLGTLCAIGHEARTLDEGRERMLALLAQQVVAQLSLRSNNRLLRQRQAALDTHHQFFQQSLDLVCTAGSDLHFRELNPAWTSALGWTLEELRARPFTSFIHPDDVEKTQAEAGQLLQGASSVHFENRYQHKDGGWVDLSWVAVVKAGIFYATARDVTVVREREGAVLKSEARLRAVIDTAVDAIITIDERGHIEDANPAVQPMFGYSPAELSGCNVSLLMPSTDRNRHDGYLANYLSGKPAKVIGIGREVTALRKDGSTFAAELSVSEFFLGDERRFTGILRDITERKRMERMQSEFVSTVSHELRTPLTSIRGSLGLVAAGITGELPQDAKEYVEIALSNSDRLVRLINDILDLEKMASGQMTFHYRTIGLRRAVDRAIAANQGFAAAHEVGLLLMGDPAPGDVVADEDRLVQVLSNLISNAVKFSPRGGCVDVSVLREGERLRVAVRDHGPGIPEAFRSRIFQRFSQADGSTTREKGGTGLGLSISKVIVEEMRGRIGFQAAEGGGTTFWFELPYLAPLEDCDEQRGTQAGTSIALVCEDDPDVARLMAGVLAADGFVVHVAPTVERARQLLQRNNYRAITLDLLLADGDGAPLVREIRSSTLNRNTPIIVVSGSMGSLGAHALSVADIVVKPFDESQLRGAIDQALKGKGERIPSLLHVEDDADIQSIVRRLLPKDWTVCQANSLTQARAHLSARSFDLVLLDLGLPDGSGEELLTHVGRAQVIVFSANELPSTLSAKVSAALIKTRASEVELRELILGLVGHPQGGP